MSCIRLSTRTVTVTTDAQRRALQAGWEDFFAREAAEYTRLTTLARDLSARLGGSATPDVVPLPVAPASFDRTSVERWTHTCRAAHAALYEQLAVLRAEDAKRAAMLRSEMVARTTDTEVARLTALATELTAPSTPSARERTLADLLAKVADNRGRLLADAAPAAHARVEELADAAAVAAAAGDVSATRDRLEELRFVVQRANERAQRRVSDASRAILLRTHLADLGVDESDWSAHLDAVIDGSDADGDLLDRIDRRIRMERLGDGFAAIGYEVPDDFGATLGGTGGTDGAGVALVVRSGATGAGDGVRLRRVDGATLAAEVVRDASALPDASADRRLEDAWLEQDLPRLTALLDDAGLETEVERSEPAGSHPLTRVAGLRPVDGRSRRVTRRRRTPTLEARP